MADFNINVNCIAPGPIDTDLLRGITSEQIQKIVLQQIIPRQFTHDSVSDLVELLLDERGSSLSGQILHVGGV
jgi:3-oxoacyl-[acyl-carrier protein] reductase